MKLDDRSGVRQKQREPREAPFSDRERFTGEKARNLVTTQRSERVLDFQCDAAAWTHRCP